MINYHLLPLQKDIIDALSELDIEYVFQPIFFPDGKTVYAREALMRPRSMTVRELIEKYAEEDKLHILEVATLFEATAAYIDRGYEEMISVNSFPSECFSDEENMAFESYFGDKIGTGIMEMMEYPRLSLIRWALKAETFQKKQLPVAIDSFGTGTNDMSEVEILQPHLVKLDRLFVSDIDKDEKKQEKCKKIIEELHEKQVLVVAKGIETKEEFEFFVSAGADFFQGYYLGRPK